MPTTTANINNSTIIDPTGFATGLPVIPDALEPQASGTSGIARQYMASARSYIFSRGDIKKSRALRIFIPSASAS